MKLTVLAPVLVAALAATLSRPVLAQSRVRQSTGSAIRGEIHGLVVENGGRPVARAVVDVTSASDSTEHRRASTRGDGSFRVVGLTPGRYRVRIRALGFAPRTLARVVVSATSPAADVGRVSLTAAAVKLDRVIVAAPQQRVDLAPDRNTYVVKDMPTTSGGSALDVLRNVPSVDVDIDNTVSLRGDPGVVVQINGRKTPMTPTQLGNFLAQLPASMVEKVEVIPNPGANEDPDGVAGIINVVLKREPDATAAGGITVTGGSTGRVQVGGNGGYQRGRLSVFGSYGFMRDDRPRSERLFREDLYADPLTYLDESGSRTEMPLAHTFTGSADYKPDPHDDLSADLLFSTRHESNSSSFFYRNLDSSYVLTGMTDRLRTETHHEYDLESTIAFTHAFASQGHKLSAEARVDRGREGGPSLYTTQSLSPAGSPAGAQQLESSAGWEHPVEGTVKLDYVRPLAGALRLAAGYKGWLQQFHTTLDTRVFDTAQAAYVVDPTRTSDFTFDERVHAGYGMLTGAYDSFEFQAGARVELAATRFHMLGSSDTYDNRYASVFPSGLLAYNLDTADQVKVSYSTRIRRPDDTDLIDPTIRYQDPLNLFRGNPHLRPEYIRAFEVGIQRSTDRATLQLTPFYRHTLNAVRRIRTIDSTGVTTTTFANVATTDAYGADATVALHGGRVSGFLGASAFRQASNAANIQPGLSARTFGWTARTNMTWHASKTLDLQALLFYRGPMTLEQGREAAQTRVDIAARQRFMGDRFNVTVRVVDPFRTEHWEFTTTDPSFVQTSDFMPHVRGVLLSLSWNFGKPLKDHRGGSDLAGGGSGAS